jgi:hypothetical protein
LQAVGNHCNEIHLGTQLDEVARLRRRGLENRGSQRIVIADGYVAKEIQVRNDVLAAETVFCQFGEEILATSRNAFDAVQDFIALRAAASGDRVVEATTVAHYRHHWPRDIRIENVTDREAQRPGALYCVRRMVAFLWTRCEIA